MQCGHAAVGVGWQHCSRCCRKRRRRTMDGSTDGLMAAAARSSALSSARLPASARDQPMTAARAEGRQGDTAAARLGLGTPTAAASDSDCTAALSRGLMQLSAWRILHSCEGVWRAAVCSDSSSSDSPVTRLGASACVTAPSCHLSLSLSLSVSLSLRHLIATPAASVMHTVGYCETATEMLRELQRSKKLLPPYNVGLHTLSAR